jgi:uncharacterized protein (UPF0332 family)
MSALTTEDCLKHRLLREIPPDREKSKKSLEVAKVRLGEAGNALKAKFFQYAVLAAYMAMFHAARALLYRDGMQEKSHLAVYIYLKEKYADKIPINVLNLLSVHRIERHETLYGLEYTPAQQDASRAIEDAKTFVKEIEKAL